MSGRDYHLKELQIAQSEDDRRHILPKVPPESRRVLDVGCGAGQTLIALKLPKTIEAAGIDFDLDAIALGRELDPSLNLIQGSGETLPYSNESFDFVFSRVALPLMHIPMALREMARVLEPGGSLWIVLHPWTMTLRTISRSITSLRVRDFFFQCYVLLNSVCFHFTGRLVRWPCSGGRYECFQTDGGIRRALTKSGFSDIRIAHGYHFVVTAKKIAGTEIAR